MLTTRRPLRLAAVNDTAATFAVDRQVVTACAGMDRFIGEYAYVGGAPAAPPTIEFSMNGSNWSYSQPAPVGANAAAGVNLYTWDIQINAWAFVRLTVPKPVGSVSGAASILPKIQN